jgi:beta-hydroxylase
MPAAHAQELPLAKLFDRDRFIAAAQSALPAFDRLLMKSAATEEHQIYPNALFPWTRDLQANAGIIRAEAKAVLHNPLDAPSLRDISPDHAKIAVDGKWRSFFLYAYGVRAEQNCARCPQTARLVSKIPGLLSAFYSVMMAGAHVPRHTGPTKAILTGHLGLVIPAEREKCRMAVGDRTVVWKQGEAVIFDDMYPHEVWNDTNEDRIILLLHIKRPLRFPGSALRDLFFAGLRASPFVRDGMQNLDRWEKAKSAAANGDFSQAA